MNTKDEKKRKRFYNNGVINRMFSEGDDIPDGFTLGKLPLTEEQIRKKSEKIKQTCLKRYGVENISQIKEVKEKKEKTLLKNYGVTHYTKSKELVEKAKKTNLKKYGAEYTFQSEKVKDKIKQTNLKKYGVEYTAQSEDIKEKTKKTNLERYGGVAPLCSEDIKSEVRKTNFERYGVENPNQNKEIREKGIQTCLDKYGVENVSSLEDIKEKKKDTLLKNYGVDSPLRSDEIKERVHNTVRKRYGVDNLSQNKDIRARINEHCNSKYGVPWPCQIDSVRKVSRGRNSAPNKEFESLLINNGIEYVREFSIENREYDFKVGNTLIEINPTATHNTIWSPFKKDSGSVDRFYHADKTHLAEERGYRVIHIFDWDDVGKVLNLLKDREKVYARKCIVKEIGKDECGIFLQENHLQGSCRGQDIRLGLFYQEELVSLMTFGRPRYNSGYEWELLRYCSVKNVIGGAEKIFKYFISTHKNCSIISYCDRSKFRGEIYKKLGFKIMSQGLPSCHWYNLKNNKHYTDNLIRQRGVDQILKTSYGKGTDNTELMIKEGYVPVYDCGQDSYVYKVAGN